MMPSEILVPVANPARQRFSQYRWRRYKRQQGQLDTVDFFTTRRSRFANSTIHRRFVLKSGTPHEMPSKAVRRL
jgi:hypothetical protein